MEMMKESPRLSVSKNQIMDVGDFKKNIFPDIQMEKNFKVKAETSSPIVKLEMFSVPVHSENDEDPHTNYSSEEHDSDDSWHLETKKEKRNMKHGEMSKREYNLARVSCDICHKTIRRLDLMRHIAAIHDRSLCTFECDFCGKNFFDKRGIRDHLSIHVEMYPFVCNHCGKKFKRNSAKNGHMRRAHRDESKNLICEACGMKCRDKVKIWYLKDFSHASFLRICIYF